MLLYALGLVPRGPEAAVPACVSSVVILLVVLLVVLAATVARFTGFLSAVRNAWRERPARPAAFSPVLIAFLLSTAGILVALSSRSLREALGGSGAALLVSTLSLIPFLLVGWRSASRQEQSLLTMMVAITLGASAVAALSGTGIDLCSIPDSGPSGPVKSGPELVLLFTDPRRILIAIILTALVGWVAGALGAAGLRTMADREADTGTVASGEVHGPVVLPGQASIVAAWSTIRGSKLHLGVHALVLVLLVAAAAVGSQVEPLVPSGSGPVPVALTNLNYTEGYLYYETGSLSDGQENTYQTILSLPKVEFLELQLLWYDEGDVALHDNQPDSFDLVLIGPDGEEWTVSGSNPPGDAGNLTIPIVESTSSLDEVSYNITVRLTQTGDQEPSIGPAPLGIRTLSDTSNDYEIMIYGGYYVEE